MNKTLRTVIVVLVFFILILLLLMTAIFFFTRYQLGQYGVTDVHYQGVSWKHKTLKFKKLSWRLYDNPVTASGVNLGFSNDRTDSGSNYHFSIDSIALTFNSRIVQKLASQGYVTSPIVMQDITGSLYRNEKNAFIFMDVKDVELTLSDTDQRHRSQQVFSQWHVQVPLGDGNRPLTSQVDFASVSLFSANADAPLYPIEINRVEATVTKANQLRLSIDEIKPLWPARGQLPPTQTIQDTFLKADLLAPLKTLAIEIKHANLGVPDLSGKTSVPSTNDTVQSVLATAGNIIQWLSTPFMSTLTIDDLNFADYIKQGAVRYSGVDNLLTLASPTFNAEMTTFKGKDNRSVKVYLEDSNKNDLSCQINVTQPENKLDSATCKIDTPHVNRMGSQLGLINMPWVFVKGDSLIKVGRVNDGLYHASIQMPEQITVKAKEKNNEWESLVIKTQPDLQIVVNTHKGLITLDEPFDVDLQASPGKKTFDLRVGQVTCNSHDLGFQIKGRIDFTIDRYMAKGSHVKDLAAKGNMDIVYSGQNTKIAVDALRVSAAEARYLTWSLSSLVAGGEQVMLQKNHQEGSYALSIAGLQMGTTLSLPAEHFKAALQGNVTKSKLYFDEKFIPYAAEGVYFMDLKASTYKKLDFPAVKIKGTVKTKDEKIYTNSKISNDRDRQLAQITTESNKSFNEHIINIWQNDLSFSPSRSLKKSYFETVPVDIDIVSGVIGYHATMIASNKNGLSGVIAASINKLTGNYDGYLFKDLTTKGALEFSPKGIRLKENVNIKADKISIHGIVLSRLSSIVNMDSAGPSYQLFDTQAIAYKGVISTKGFKTKSLANIAPFTINVKNLDIENILQSFHYNDVIMTGKLDGVIPLSIENYAPVVKNGKLHSATTSGVLKYRKGGQIAHAISGTNDESLEFVTGILSNYHYHSLQVDADYSKKGTLNTLLKFKGSNPDFQDGKDVNINLRIEDNIPKLLQTIDAVDSNIIEDYIQDKLTQ